eukprot:TRINITY_DN780269_c0_g1_i1.p1 TRINITY_DN780269_c0_g1~~TRINITY_DN780269_c0_g1_i1.p1  ORF type:complete len:444 (-),score=115.65 TRINITY_DN780269_c0_g1_i1:136-1467(-)
MSVWREVRSGDGVYYFSEETGETSWDAPQGCTILPFEEAEEAQFSEDEEYEPTVRSTVTRSTIGLTPWVKSKTESGEEYYHNVETDETSWDVPTETYPPMKFNIDSSLSLKEHISGLNFFDGPFEENRIAMLKGDCDASQCYLQLSHLNEVLMQYRGSDEIVEVLENDNFRLPRRVYRYLGVSTPGEVRTMAATVLLLMVAHYKDLLGMMLSVWGVPSKILTQCDWGLTETIEMDDTQGIVTWLKFTRELLDSVQLPEEVLPSEEFAKSVISAVAEGNEEVFLEGARTLMSLSACFEEHADNVVMRVCRSESKAECLSEAVLHLLNKLSGSDPNNEIPLSQCIQLATTFFSDPSTSSFFYTNDLKVMVDVICREITDLSSDSAFLPRFFHLLDGLLLHSQWKDCGFYRKTDILNLLNIFRSHSSDEVKAFCEHILASAGSLLE